jgi:uncharacterized protein (TIGR03067 family)
MRKFMACVTVSVLMAGTAVWGGDAKADKEKMQGTWTLTSVVVMGNKQDIPGGKEMRMIIKGDTITVKTGEKDEEGTFKIDASKKPKQITLQKKDGGADDVMNGIYELQGDTLKIAAKGKGAKSERPTGFDDAGAFVMILKKAKS